MMSKVDGKDFVRELYGIMGSDGSGTTLPRAISKFVYVHAQAFVFTMAQRYHEKTHTRICRKVLKIENCNLRGVKVRP